LKYLVQSAVGSMLVLLGISMLFAQTGTVVIAEIKTAAVPQMVLLGAAASLLVGFGVKSALVPMHTWLPDAHSQAPSGISAMLSGVVIEAGLIAMLRSLSAVAGVSQSWALLLLGFAAINMLIGNLMALRQTQVKRLLAYSSLAHMGYILLGIGIAVYSGQVNGAEGSLFHLFNHGVMKGLAFLSAGALLYALHVVSGSHAPLTVTDLNGAARKYPLLGITFTLALLGLGGIPPLAGFMSKWQIFLAGFETGSLGIDLLVVFAALNSVLSLAYYAPLINAMYRLTPSESVQAGKPVPFSMSLPLILLAAATVVVGFWPGLLHWLTAPAGNVLLQILGK
jgi:formate hydrogenlyase subunit 3/multisubunit Na+/H+ antiporter MnhD subunit